MSAPHLPAGLVAPTYDTTSLAAVLPAVAGALGHDLATATGLTAAGSRAALGLPEADRAVVVLVDGLGIRNLAERGGTRRSCAACCGSGTPTPRRSPPASRPPPPPA
nr:hypothetical protein GCM10025730_52270 [Promicromonospora thailandica]